MACSDSTDETGEEVGSSVVVAVVDGISKTTLVSGNSCRSM
jgi:hypothetical protein